MEPYTEHGDPPETREREDCASAAWIARYPLR